MIHVRGAGRGCRLAAAMLIGLIVPGPAGAVATRYIDFETFQAWRSLAAPAGGDVRLCSLTRVAHELWAHGQLRVPLSPATVATGRVRTGRELWAILLEVGAEPAPCDHVLVLARAGPTWRRLLVRRLELDQGVVPAGLAWDGGREAFGVDTGERARVTAPATLTWADGRVTQATPGFVVEVLLIRHVLWWRGGRPGVEYERRATPMRWSDVPGETHDARDRDGGAGFANR